MIRRAAVALLFVALAVVAGTARAHAIGVSRGDYRASAGHVDAEIALARGDVALLVGSGDVAAAAPAMQAAIVDAIHVSADGAACAGILEGAAPVEGDGVVIHAKYTCPAEARGVRIAFDVLGELPHGHRHLAHVAGASAADAVLFAGESTLDVPLAEAAPLRAGGALAFVAMGIEHILSGYDHLVFLVGLVLVAPLAGGGWRRLGVVVTAFTLGHSITLAMAVLGVWIPSPAIIEPAIALSIAYVGIENLLVRDAARRWLVTFPFGLVHGFGFAGALREIDLPRAEIPAALVGFNAGVELGQIAVLLVLLPALALLRRFAGFGDRATKSSSAAIALAGVGWFVARVAPLARFAALFVAVASLTACGHREPRATEADAGPSASDAGAAEADDVSPVYPTSSRAVDPVAVRFCTAIHEVPEARRAACCAEAPGVVFTGECVRTLSFAMASGAVTVDPAAVDRCVAAVDAAYAGCDWPGPFAPPVPAACEGILVGTLASGARCRSSLECAGGLRCAGVGPTTMGRCAAARADGERCGGSADALASSTRQSDLDAQHPECAGFCQRAKCAPIARIGAECTHPAQCGRGASCTAGKCAPAASVASRKPAGAACANDFECRGGCLREPGHARGTCGMKCGIR
jgi:hypothetical protein